MEAEETKINNYHNHNNDDANSNNNGTFFNDVDINHVNPNGCGENRDEKQQGQAKGATVKKMGSKEEFEKKMQDIANNEDYEWIAAIIAIDDYGAFVFSIDNCKEVVLKEIDKMEKEMYHLFAIYGNGNNINTMKHFGFDLARGDEFGLILYDSKDSSKCLVPGHETIETLKEELMVKCHLQFQLVAIW